MNHQTVFELRVWKNQEDSCIFLLLWDGREKNLSISQRYPKPLKKAYNRWQQAYNRYYNLPNLSPVSESGSLTLASGDEAHDLMEAKRVLVLEFQQWLQGENIRQIYDQIQDELTRLVQSAAEKPQHSKPSLGVDLYLTCDLELSRLPWEVWRFAKSEQYFKHCRLIRTGNNTSEVPPSPQLFPYRSKGRVLTILGDDAQLDLTEDLKALRRLKTVAQVEVLDWRGKKTVDAIKQLIIDKISDPSGWDILYFAGHSHETQDTGGRLVITPNISLSSSDLEDCLSRAVENGLQLVILNSCRGLSIAHRLMNLGLQVVVMREPILNEVAQVFLKQLCQSLAHHQNIYQAVEACRTYLKSESFAFPSTDLVPSFFCPIGLSPFELKSRSLGDYTRQWIPTKREGIGIGIALLLNSMVFIQDVLSDTRTFVQAVYRDTTDQMVERDSSTTPPVRIISIDRSSIAQARTDFSNRGDEFSEQPIDRKYLATLINKLSALQVKTIGVDYYLHIESDKYLDLAKAIRTSVSQNKTHFVFATNEYKQWGVSPNIASDRWSLQGDTTFLKWNVELPQRDNINCVYSCPFAYMLAIAHQLEQRSQARTLIQPDLSHDQSFPSQISHALRQKNIEHVFAPEQLFPAFNLKSMIDFSIPPDLAYDRTSALELRQVEVPNLAFKQRIQQQVVIIASGGYDAAQDKYSLPLATEYWLCHSPRRKNDPPPFLSHGSDRRRNSCLYGVSTAHPTSSAPNSNTMDNGPLHSVWERYIHLFISKAPTKYPTLISVGRDGYRLPDIAPALYFSLTFGSSRSPQRSIFYLFTPTFEKECLCLSFV